MSDSTQHRHPPSDDPKPTSASAGGRAHLESVPVFGEGEERAWRRLSAGLAVELGLADKKVARHWQERVRAGEFDADACAAEILEAGGFEAGDARLVERSARLQRDLVMTPLSRSAGRKVRRAARGGLAFLVAQLLAIGVYSLLVAIALVLLRLQGVAFDPLLDRALFWR